LHHNLLVCECVARPEIGSQLVVTCSVPLNAGRVAGPDEIHCALGASDIDNVWKTRGRRLDRIRPVGGRIRRRNWRLGIRL
jgi:hypothetical protein